jgi:hypothetical protein
VTSLTTRSRQARTRLYDPALVAQLAVVALAIGTLLFAVGVLALPARSDVTVVNGSDYDLDVVVHGPHDDTAVVFGRVDRGRTRTQPHLLDPGDEWVFEFSHGATDLGELRLTQDQLDDLDHQVDIPVEITRRARAEGLTPSPE